jgi:hypothetical protein
MLKLCAVNVETVREAMEGNCKRVFEDPSKIYRKIAL